MNESIDKCAQCPHVSSARVDMEHARLEAERVTGLAVMKDEDLQRDFLYALPSEELKSKAIRDLRKQAARLLERQDIACQLGSSIIGELTADCEGPLKMRAAKAGRQVLVILCCSPSTEDGETNEIVTVVREPLVESDDESDTLS